MAFHTIKPRSGFSSFSKGGSFPQRIVRLEAVRIAREGCFRDPRATKMFREWHLVAVLDARPRTAVDFRPKSFAETIMSLCGISRETSVGYTSLAHKKMVGFFRRTPLDIFSNTHCKHKTLLAAKGSTHREGLHRYEVTRSLITRLLSAGVI